MKNKLQNFKITVNKDQPSFQLAFNTETKVTWSHNMRRIKENIEDKRRPQKDSERYYIAWDDNDMVSFYEFEKEEEVYLCRLINHKLNKLNNLTLEFTYTKLFCIYKNLDWDSSKLKHLISTKILILPPEDPPKLMYESTTWHQSYCIIEDFLFY